MAKRVGISDVAQALGLSRNTVSKALNGSPYIAEATRERVLDMAAQMNYKMMGTRCEGAARKEYTILIICKENKLLDHVFRPFMLEMQQLIYQRGATSIVQFMFPQDIAQLALPTQIMSVDGVIGIEILDQRYMETLLATGKPCVFFDCPIDMQEDVPPFDVVLEDEAALRAMMKKIAQKKEYTTFGFVGNPRYCAGFQRRYDAFRLAMGDCGISDYDQYSCLADDMNVEPYRQAWKRMIQSDRLAQVLCFANSGVCATAAKILLEEGIEIGRRVHLVSFGMTHHAKEHCSLLGSVTADRKGVVASLVQMLFDRLQAPDQSSRMLLVKSHMDQA